MFKLVFLSILFLSLYSDDNFGFDNLSTQASSLWNKTKEYSNKTWDKTKEYSNIGKNIVIEQTVLNGTNSLIDISKIKLIKFDIDDKSNDIYITLFLKGEDKLLNIKINDFQWGVTEDKEYIVFENFKISLDIPWLNYLVQDKLKRDDNKLIIPNNISIFPILFSIKPNKNLKYNIEKKSFDFVHYDWDKDIFSINKFIVKNNKIDIDIKTKGTAKNIICKIDNFRLRTANKKTLIVLEKIDFNTCNRPWISSIVESQDNKVFLNYTDSLYELFDQ